VPVIQVYRGDKVESEHGFDAVLVSAAALIRSWGDASRQIFTRSLIKPIQAKVSLDFIRAAGFNLSPEQIVIASSSHNAETDQLKVVNSILDDFSLDPALIACGHSHNCSGKHSAILAACSAASLSREYLSIEHPYHHALAAELYRLGLKQEPYSCSDGCGLQTYHMTMTELASLFAVMISDPAYIEIIEAMNSYPLLVGGARQFDSLLMQAYPMTYIAKGGAEGLMMVANLKTGEVIVLKLRDGAKRVKSYAVAALMRELDWDLADVYETSTINAQGLITGAYVLASC